jgi:hypothetical protein
LKIFVHGKICFCDFENASSESSKAAVTDEESSKKYLLFKLRI